MKRNILIPRFYPGGFLKEMIGKVLDPYVKKLVPRQNVLKRMAKHYEKFEDASKYPGKEMEGNRQNYRDVFEDEFGMLRNKQFAANSNIPDAFVNTGRLNESQLKRMSDLYKLDPEQLTANELKELQELSRINSGLSQYQEPVAEWSPFVDLQRQPIDRRSIQLADYDQYSLPTVYNNIRPSVNASSATKNHGYPDWRLDPAQPLPDSYLPQEAVEVKSIKDMEEIIRQQLLKEKRYGINNGTNGYYLDNSLGGNPKTFKLKKIPRDEGYWTPEEIVGKGFVNGTDPKGHTTYRARQTAQQGDINRGQTVELRGREKGSVNGMGSIGAKWTKAEANGQIPKELRRKVTNAARNGASNKEIDKMRHDILKQLGLL